MSVMNEAERRRFLKTLRSDDEFREEVRREILTQELLHLPHTVATLVDVVAQQRQDFTSLAAMVRTYMERTVTMVGEGFTEMRAEFTGVRGELSEVRGELFGVRGELSEVRGELSELRAGFVAVDARFDQVEARLDHLDAEVREIKDRLAS